MYTDMATDSFSIYLSPVGVISFNRFVIATGVLTVVRFVPHGNWRTHLLANRPVGGCWARRPCHSLVGPPGAT